MTSKCTFICGLHNIEVNEDLGEGIVLVPNEKNSDFPSIRLTNNKGKIKSLLDKELSRFIGGIEYNHLLGVYPIVAFAESEFDPDTMTSIQHLDLHLILLKMYFFCLWLTKDNAVDFDMGFLQFANKAGELEVSVNNMTNSNFDVSGKRSSTKFSKEELNSAIKSLKESIEIKHKDRPKIASASSLTKVSVANYFVQSSMAAPDLGLKTVGYCSALETLFANGDNTELAHKLSERVSKFLETDLEKRKEVYKNVKEIYEMRSKVVHGASFKPQKMEELSGLVKKADQICRRVMIYVLTTPDDKSIFDKSKEDLDSYFLELALR